MREQVRRKHLGRHLLSTAQNRRREPDLAKLRDLPRAEAIRIAMSTLDKAAGKGIIHKNKAARHKSRLSAKVKALSA